MQNISNYLRKVLILLIMNVITAWSFLAEYFYGFEYNENPSPFSFLTIISITLTLSGLLLFVSKRTEKAILVTATGMLVWLSFVISVRYFYEGMLFL